MAKKEFYKVLHAPTSVGGNPQGLSRALKKLGISSVSWIYRRNQFEYESDREIWRPRYGVIRREVARLLAIIQAALSYQIIHYNSGSTLAGACPLPPNESSNSMINFLRRAQVRYLFVLFVLELRILRAIGCRIFVHFQGNDVRQGDFLRLNYRDSVADRVPDNFYNDISDEFKRKVVRHFDQVSDQMYALNPDLMRILPERTKFQAYCHVCLNEWQPIYSQLEARRPLRLCHAPSNRSVKGTDLIVQALDELHAEGHAFEFVLVEGLSNSEAKKRYESVDVLIDQLFIGWYGGLAVEAMALGKPVIVYLREEDLRFIPAEMRAELPFIRASSESIKMVLREVLTMPRNELLQFAYRSRRFVERWHDPSKIAAEIKSDYELALQRRKKI